MAISNEPSKAALGRTAAWVHVMSWLFLVSTFVVFFWLQREDERFQNNEEPGTVLAVGLSAFVVSWVWSFTLALRGILRGGSEFRAEDIILVSLVEMVVAGILLLKALF